jgi:hypothetical protein
MPTNLTLPHKPKQNNCIKLFYTQNDRMKKNKGKNKRERKKEEERRKKRERRKWKVVQGSRLAGSRQVSPETHGFFFFFFPVVGLAASPRRRSAQTPRGDPPHKKSTTGHRDSRLGLAGRGFGFFLVLE